MSKRIVFVALAALLAFTCVFGKADDAKKKEINRVKKDTAKYLYSEVTTTDQETALSLAEDMLYQEINKYVASKKRLSKSNNVVVRNTKSSWETITLPRGNMYRAFIYVRKSDIIPADNATVTTVEQPQPAQSVVEVVSPYDETVGRLLHLQRFSELESCLRQLKQEGRVSHFGKYKTLSNQADYVLLIYNQQGDIEAVLSEGTTRSNLRTGQPDDVSNYKGRGAFGVKINK